MTLRAFGLALEPAMALPGAWESVPAERSPLEILEARPEQLERAYSGTTVDGWRGTPDGRAMRIKLADRGDVLVTLNGHAAFHLDAPRRRLLCHLPPGDVTSMRVLLDSVLFTASLLGGREVLHCGAVLCARGAVAVVAGTGGGKSTLISLLVAAGNGFLTDDILALERTTGGPVAHAGPPLLTRPSHLTDGPGTPLATVGDETWCALPVAAASSPIAAVVVLDRAGDGEPRLDLLDASPLALLPHLVPFPQSRDRERSRFEVASDVASRAELYRLSASPTASPERLAAVLAPALT